MRFYLSIIAFCAIFCLAQAASIATKEQQQHQIQADEFVGRQAPFDYSGEDSDETDDEDAEAEQLQQQILAQQQQAIAAAGDDSDEDGGGDDDDVEDEEDDDDDAERRRRRRDVAAEEVKEHDEDAMAAADAVDPSDLAIPSDPESSALPPTPAPAIPPVSTVTGTKAGASSNTTVLILIRNALKKVTTALPPRQVSTALQYFQWFQLFLQQAIEQVIDNDDDDDDDLLDLNEKPEAEVAANVEELAEGDKKPIGEGESPVTEGVAEASAAEGSGGGGVVVVPNASTEGSSSDIATSTEKSVPIAASSSTSSIETSTVKPNADAPMMATTVENANNV